MDVVSLARRTAQAHGFCPDSCGRDECDLARALLKAVEALEHLAAVDDDMPQPSPRWFTWNARRTLAELRGATSSGEAHAATCAIAEVGARHGCTCGFGTKHVLE